MLEEPRHHIMNKQAFQACLAAWRNGDWPNGVISANVHATAALKSFPSPDSTLFDEQNKRVIAFEFKPPTETKRGMLTSIGQAFAYLNSANAAFVISPKTVEGYAIGDYLSDTFKHHIVGRAPVGLLIYEDDDPSNIHIAIDIDPATIIEKKIDRNEISNRYWAKHVDMSWDAMFEIGRAHV